MSQKRPVVLIIDDEADIRRLLADFLEDEDRFEVLLAADGLEALESAKRHAVDVCVVDLRMPGLDGIEFMRRAASLNPKLQFVVHTGATEDCLPPGVNDLTSRIRAVLHKPITNYAELIAAIDDGGR